MTRSIMVSVVAALMIFLLSTACTKKQPAEDRKTVDDLILTVFYARTPLVKGKNDLKITVAKKSGQVVPKAMIETRLSSIGPSGVQTSFMVPGELVNGAYAFKAELSVSGDWKMDVTVTRFEGNKPPVNATFNFKVE